MSVGHIQRKGRKWRKYRDMQLIQKKRNQFWIIIRSKTDAYVCKYMSESLHADYYLELDVNSIFFCEHHQNREKHRCYVFFLAAPSVKIARPNIPSGPICLNNIYLLYCLYTDK